MCKWVYLLVLYINSLRASVRPPDATVPRFNPPAEPARTVGFEKPDSAWTVGFGKRVPGFGKTGGQTGQGGAGGRAGSVCSSVLQGRAGGRAVREGQGPNKE
jgi:hypothetical protein